MILLSDAEIRKALKDWEMDDPYYIDNALDAVAICNKAQLKQVVEWGYEDCPHKEHGDSAMLNKFECPECRQALLKEID